MPWTLHVPVLINVCHGTHLHPRPSFHCFAPLSIANNSTRALIMRALQANPYTSKLTLAQQREVSQHMLVQDFAPDEVVIKQGDIGDCLYVIAGACTIIATIGVGVVAVRPVRDFKGKHRQMLSQ